MSTHHNRKPNKLVDHQNKANVVNRRERKQRESYDPRHHPIRLGGENDDDNQNDNGVVMSGQHDTKTHQIRPIISRCGGHPQVLF